MTWTVRIWNEPIKLIKQRYLQGSWGAGLKTCLTFMWGSNLQRWQGSSIHLKQFPLRRCWRLKVMLKRSTNTQWGNCCSNNPEIKENLGWLKKENTKAFPSLRPLTPPSGNKGNMIIFENLSPDDGPCLLCGERIITTSNWIFFCSSWIQTWSMDGWMCNLKSGWVDLDGCFGGLMDEGMDRIIDGWLDRLIDKQMD